METINANAAMLSNYEVMLVLQQIKDSKKSKKQGSLATVTYETLRFLQDSECKNQSEETISKLLESLKSFGLTKTEKLMMINTPPRSALEIQLIVQESEERLSETQVDEILKIFNEILPIETD